MASPAALSLRRASDSELCFAHRPIVGVLVVLGAGALLYAMATREPAVPWWIMALATIFPLAGLHNALWRFELRIDLITGNYRLRKGLWPSPSSTEGCLDELRSIVLAKTWDRLSSEGRGSETLLWTLELDFAEPVGSICVLATRREEKARCRLAEWALKLRRPTVDRTTNREEVRQVDELERPWRRGREQAESASGVIAQPPGGAGIDLTEGPTGRIILLPRFGWHLGTVFFMFFGLAFGGFALLALSAALGIVPLKVSGSRAAVILISTLFSVIGLGMAAIPILAAGSRQRVEESGDALLFSTSFFGRPRGLKRLRRDRIEGIDIRANTLSSLAEGKEVVVRGEGRVVILGRELDAAAQRWLRDTLGALAAG